MIQDEIKKLIDRGIKELWGQRVHDHDVEIFIERPDNRNFGDYATSVAFLFAKIQKRPPNDLAGELTIKLLEIKPESIEKIEAVGGYVNFFLAPDFLRQQLAEIHKGLADFGRSNVGHGRPVIVEYSQPNIAKKMHIGHLRTTILGDALANIYEAVGYKVTRWNYLGDWGTQFGKLIAAYKLWGEKEEVEKEPITTLLALYVRFHKELKEHPELERRGQEEFAKLEKGDEENRKLWQWFRNESLKEFDKMYQLLGIRFDTTTGESHYEKNLRPLVDDLLKRGIAEIGEEGAIIIKLDADKLPPALIRKADGASLYLTRDLAGLKHRLKEYEPEKILYVVGNEQALHFQQLFAVARLLGLNGAELEHIKYGLVLGENHKKLATREGEVIPLEEVIDKAIKLAKEIVEQKNAKLVQTDKMRIAQTVAVGALKYEMLNEHRNSDIVFDWQRMLDFSGNSGPYLQYTYARLASILRKAGFLWRLGIGRKPDFGLLKEPVELTIIKHLLDFPEIITDSARLYLTNNLALYLYEFANLANRFYELAPILKDENVSRRNARLVLVSTTASILQTGLNLLGIRVLEKI